MARCRVCGNEYDKAFTVRMADGNEGTFDSFECAIHAFAPTCAHCGCRVMGHGVESNGTIFCCASCAEMSGVQGLSDRTNGGESATARSGGMSEGLSATRPPADS